MGMVLFTSLLCSEVLLIRQHSSRSLPQRGLLWPPPLHHSRVTLLSSRTAPSAYTHPHTPMVQVEIYQSLLDRVQGSSSTMPWLLTQGWGLLPRVAVRVQWVSALTEGFPENVLALFPDTRDSRGHWAGPLGRGYRHPCPSTSGIRWPHWVWRKSGRQGTWSVCPSGLGGSTRLPLPQASWATAFAWVVRRALVAELFSVFP